MKIDERLESFITAMVTEFGRDPREVIEECLRVECELKVVYEILYLHACNKDPFLNREVFAMGKARQGLNKMIAELKALRECLDREDNVEAITNSLIGVAF